MVKVFNMPLTSASMSMLAKKNIVLLHCDNLNVFGLHSVTESGSIVLELVWPFWRKDSLEVTLWEQVLKFPMLRILLTQPVDFLFPERCWTLR